MNESRKDAIVRQTVGIASVFWLFVRSTLDVRVLVFLPDEEAARPVERAAVPVAVLSPLPPVALPLKVKMLPPETIFSLVDHVL